MLRRQRVYRWLGDRVVESLTVDDLSEFVWGMEEMGYPPVTIQNAYTLAKTILDLAVRRQLIRTNPARLLPGRERPRVTRHVARVLATGEIDALPSPGQGALPDDVRVAIFAGLRSGEVSGLQWHDIDLQNNACTSAAKPKRASSYRPKPRTRFGASPCSTPCPRSRTLPGNPEPPRPDNLLFIDKDKPLRAPRLWYWLRCTAKRAGIEQHPDEPPLRFHDLRHTAASIMIAARADVSFVARQLGHATPATTLLIYAHLFDEAANVDRVRDYVNGQFAGLSAD